MLLPLLQNVELIWLGALLQLLLLLLQLMLLLLLRLPPLMLLKLPLLLVAGIAGATGKAAVASSHSGFRIAAEEE